MAGEMPAELCYHERKGCDLIGAFMMWDDPSAAPSAGTAMSEAGKTATLIYVLYLAGLVLGVTTLIGLVMAYIYRDDAPYWLRAHYQFQIRTFWIGLLYIVVGVVTTAISIGFLILLFWLVWYIVRCVKGIKLVSEGRSPPNPVSWGF
jgi:uncharacterized membrane protein